MNTNLWTWASQRRGMSGTDGWPEKRQRSPRRRGMSGRTAKVKIRAYASTTKPRCNVWRNLCTRTLLQLSRKVVCFRQVPAFNTWATAKFFNKRRYRAIPRVSLALRGGTRKGPPKAGTTEISLSRARRRPRKMRTSC